MGEKGEGCAVLCYVQAVCRRVTTSAQQATRRCVSVCWLRESPLLLLHPVPPAELCSWVSCRGGSF